MLKLDDYNYSLPQELIAEYPLEKRDASRLMVIRDQGIGHHQFNELESYLRQGDVIVYNNTRVIPARLYGKKVHNSGKVEFLWLKNEAPGLWKGLLKPSRAVREGMQIQFGSATETAIVEKRLENGQFILKWCADTDSDQFIRQHGHMPLPPYILSKRKKQQSELYTDQSEDSVDNERYQTVFSEIDGAVAAPTAGLHFSKVMIERLISRGVIFAPVTLHVGIGTFKPLQHEWVHENKIEKEYFQISQSSAECINSANEKSKRVIAVGTTAVRVLETAANDSGMLKANSGATDLFIYEGYRFKIVKNLLTNFHLPCSSLLVLVSTLVGREKIMKAYGEAVKNKYRFYSYGDAMLVLEDRGSV